VSSSDPDITKSGHIVPDISTHRQVGPYRLIREIGRGGMGTVYLGLRSDDAFQKRVAIKILKRGTDTDAIVQRFRNERQILASLEHPNIASLLDGGTTADGLPYFAMEYVEGQNILDFCEIGQLDTTARIELFRKVCGAVQYAHQNLIIHRDIKPANVLVGADGTPKLLDFGIAKLLNPELGGDAFAPTVAGPQLMTPEYASPEQVRGEPVTTATDIYSLGVLLYELLTGRRPYQLTSRVPSEIARVVCNSVPVRPSTVVTQSRDDAPSGGGTGVAPMSDNIATRGRSKANDVERLRKRLAGDLDNIVLKALSKEPPRRYASVDQFSEDLRRHLAGLPVSARKDTLGYRAGKFLQRNRAAVAAGGLILLALIAGIIGTTWQAMVARRERTRAEQRFDDVRRLANTSLFELHDAIRDLPGSTPARQLLVSNGLQYLDKLARDAGDRPDLQRELAGAYVKVGDVQGRPFNPNLGDTAGALASYKKSVAIYEALTGANASDATFQREMATAYLRLSEVLSATGATADALAYARKALDVQQRVASDTSGADTAISPAMRRELAASYSRVGDLLSATGDTSGALEQRRRALAIMETLANTAPDDVDNLRQLGVAYQKLGNQLGNPNYPNIGDTQGALRELERSADVFKRAVAAHPSNAMFQRNLAIIRSNTADVLMALGRRDEALARQREAFASFSALAAADPTNAAARNDVAISLSKIAEMLDAAGKTREAIKEYEQALQIHLSLSAADPASDSMKLEVASDSNRLATAQTKVGDRAAALANHTRAVTMSQELHARNPANVELRVAVALALMGRADAYIHFAEKGPSQNRSEDLRTAVRDYEQGVALLEKLQQEGAIEGTDVTSLENGRRELDRIRRLLEP
jgi:non-specific serine/threonine protein kinase/serine/threonine-protein kinase